MSTAALVKKELFVEGTLTKDMAEMIELLAVNVPGIEICVVNTTEKKLTVSLDSSKEEGAIVEELSSLIKTMDSSLKISTFRKTSENKHSFNTMFIFFAFVNNL